MRTRARWTLALAAVALTVTFLGTAGRRARRARAEPRRVDVVTPSAEAWPSEGVKLRVRGRRMTKTRLVMLDPGHGARENRGNFGSLCRDEQDVMLDLAVEVARRLEESWNIRALLSREPGAVVDYPARLQAARAEGVDAFVSLHSDVRGRTDRWSPARGLDCPRALDAPGFAILYSDEGDALVDGRLALARALAKRMSAAGFLAYDGAGYVGLYAGDAEERGVFVDRHPPEQRIFVLRRAAMPSVLVETHNALDPREATRWEDPETVDAFAGALAEALAELVEGPARADGGAQGPDPTSPR